MNLKKRTQAEIDKAVKKKDYTGGYEYLPWLIYMRGFGYIAPALAIFGGGIFLATEGSYLVGIGAIAVSGLIKYMLIRDYKSLKKGITH